MRACGEWRGSLARKLEPETSHREKCYNCNMRPCDFLNCENASRTSGLCATHYAQRQKGYESIPARTDPTPLCSVEHCEIESTSYAEGSLCAEHYQLQYRGIDPNTRVISGGRTRAKCLFEGCGRRSDYQKVCGNHAKRIRRGLDEAPEGCSIKVNEPCEFEGCDNPYITKKLCHGHYTQLKTLGRLQPLRDWGKYTKGDYKCDLKSCRRPAASKGLCAHHSGMASQYRISIEKMKEIWADPSCENPGCGETKRLHMDHDHATGEFRGLLCGGCNTGLGQLKEDFEKISGIAEYLKRFK